MFLTLFTCKWLEVRTTHICFNLKKVRMHTTNIEREIKAGTREKMCLTKRTKTKRGGNKQEYGSLDFLEMAIDIEAVRLGHRSFFLSY